MLTAILVDGGFLKQKLRFANNGRYPTADEVWRLCVDDIMSTAELIQDQLFRIYFYDCRPYDGTIIDPRSRESVDFGSSPSAMAQRKFLDELSAKPQTLLRAGELTYRGLIIPQDRMNFSEDGEIKINADDLVHNFVQKQVDIKMGLDIAWISLNKHVGKLVLVAGDSDLIPAMEFARQQGLLVYLAPLEHSVKFGMLEHADGLLHVAP